MRRHIVIRRSSIGAPRPRGRHNFFHQLTSTFSPPGRSSAIVIGAAQRVIASALIGSFGPTSAVIAILGGLRSDITSRHGRLISRLLRHTTGLHCGGDVVADQVGRVLHSVRRRRVGTSVRHIIGGRRILHRASCLVNNVTVLSLVVIIIFVVLVAHSVSEDRCCQRRLRGTGRCTRSLLRDQRGLVLAVDRSVHTPLSSVVNCVRLLLHHHPSRERHCCLRGVAKSTGRVLSLIGNLLSFRQLRSKRVRVRGIPFDMHALFGRVCKDFHPVTRTGKLTFILGVGRRKVSHVCSNSPVHLHRVIDGLLSGTIGFARRNHVILVIGLSVLGSRLAVAISSSNIKVPRRRRRGVFNRFTHLSKARGRRNFNLKLSVAHGLVRLVKKALSLGDIPKGKDSFAVILPLQRSRIRALRTAPTVRRRSRARAKKFRKHRVFYLLISSSPLRLTLARRFLGQGRIRIADYSGPFTIISVLHGDSFSTVVASVRVPNVSKCNLLGIVHSSNIPNASAIPIVTLSTDIRGRGARCLRINFAKFLGGPFATGRLVTLLGGLLRTSVRTRISPRFGFSSLATFTNRSGRTSTSVVQAFTRRAGGDISLLRRTLRGASHTRTTGVSRGLVPLFAVLKTSSLMTRLEVLRGGSRTLASRN